MLRCERPSCPDDDPDTEDVGADPPFTDAGEEVDVPVVRGPAQGGSDDCGVDDGERGPKPEADDEPVAVDAPDRSAEDEGPGVSDDAEPGLDAPTAPDEGEPEPLAPAEPPRVVAPTVQGPGGGTEVSIEGAPSPDDVDEVSGSGSNSPTGGGTPTPSPEAPAARPTSAIDGERAEQALTGPGGTAVAASPFGGPGDVGPETAIGPARSPSPLPVVGAVLVAALLTVQGRLAHPLTQGAGVARAAGRRRRFDEGGLTS